MSRLRCADDSPFLDLNVTPLANSYVSPDRASAPEPSFPLAVAFCPACYLVQLTGVVDPAALFSEYSYFSSYSTTYLAHASEMATTLSDRFKLNPTSSVLEIASNDGYLLQYFKRRNIPVLGVEPASNIAKVAQRAGHPHTQPVLQRRNCRNRPPRIRSRGCNHCQ